MIARYQSPSSAAVVSGARWLMTIGWLALLAVVPRFGWADDDAEKADDPARKQAERRMEYMRQAVQRFAVTIKDQPDSKIEPQKELILRWSNPTTNVKDGSLGVFTHEGRPVVFVELQLHNARTMINEFARLTPARVEVRSAHDEVLVWSPGEEHWSDFEPLPDGPQPADREPLRLIQMKRLAEGFRVVDHFGSKEIVIQDLRLMATPAYRYGGMEDVIDGAVFVFAQGTNPEAILTIEAYRDGDETGWRYAFTPSTIYELDVYVGEKVVWNKPRYMNFGTTRGPYYAFPYRRHPDDDDLQGAFPKPKPKE